MNKRRAILERRARHFRGDIGEELKSRAGEFRYRTILPEWTHHPGTRLSDPASAWTCPHLHSSLRKSFWGYEGVERVPGVQRSYGLVMRGVEDLIPYNHNAHICKFTEDTPEPSGNASRPRNALGESTGVRPEKAGGCGSSHTWRCEQICGAPEGSQCKHCKHDEYQSQKRTLVPRYFSSSQ